MGKYLLDTDICIFLFKDMVNLVRKVKDIGITNCCVSEVTVAELKFGAEYSDRKEFHMREIDYLCNNAKVIPISNVIDVFAVYKSNLRKRGRTIGDFDVMIAATAIFYDYVLVTNNVKHFELIDGLTIENWTLDDGVVR